MGAAFLWENLNHFQGKITKSTHFVSSCQLPRCAEQSWEHKAGRAAWHWGRWHQERALMCVCLCVAPPTGMGGTSQSFLIIQDPSCDILVLCLVSKLFFCVSYRHECPLNVMVKPSPSFQPRFAGWLGRLTVVHSRWYLKE